MGKSSPFEDITIEWDGDKFAIPASRVLGAIARIENHVTLTEIHHQAALGGAFRLTKIAAAYASVLQYAGRSGTTTEEIYVGLFGEDQGDMRENVMAAISGLMNMMVPPSKRGAPVGTGKESPGRARRSKSSGSSKSTSKS